MRQWLIDAVSCTRRPQSTMIDQQPAHHWRCMSGSGLKHWYAEQPGTGPQAGRGRAQNGACATTATGRGRALVAASVRRRARYGRSARPAPHAPCARAPRKLMHPTDEQDATVLASHRRGERRRAGGMGATTLRVSSGCAAAPRYRVDKLGAAGLAQQTGRDAFRAAAAAHTSGASNVSC